MNKYDRMAAGTLPRGEYPATDMTICEWYAGMALQGLIARNNGEGSYTPKIIASVAFKIAEAMEEESDKLAGLS